MTITRKALIISLAFLPLIASNAHAAAPQIFISWHTSGSYIPVTYPGKALPTYGSQITASIQLIDSNKIANLSGNTIYWYLNNTLLGGGVGAQTISFPPLGIAPNVMTLEADITDYKGGTYLIKEVPIPMVLPQAVIYAPFPGGQFSKNPITVTAIPYFFNIDLPDNLSYSWSVNNQTGSNAENPSWAQISLPQGTPAGTTFQVSLTVSNSNDSTQAVSTKSLTYQPSLQ